MASEDFCCMARGSGDDAALNCVPCRRIGVTVHKAHRDQDFDPARAPKGTGIKRQHLGHRDKKDSPLRSKIRSFFGKSPERSLRTPTTKRHCGIGVRRVPEEHFYPLLGGQYSDYEDEDEDDDTHSHDHHHHGTPPAPPPGLAPPSPSPSDPDGPNGPDGPHHHHGPKSPHAHGPHHPHHPHSPQYPGPLPPLTPDIPQQSSGFGKWLPYLIIALILIALGLLAFFLFRGKKDKNGKVSSDAKKLAKDLEDSGAPTTDVKEAKKIAQEAEVKERLFDEPSKTEKITETETTGEGKTKVEAKVKMDGGRSRRRNKWW